MTGNCSASQRVLANSLRVVSAKRGNPPLTCLGQRLISANYGKLLLFAMNHVGPLLLTNEIKVGSYDPISIQLTLKISVCVMEFIGVHTIQFLHPIIS